MSRSYDVSGLVDSLKEQLADTAVRAALAEARLASAEKEIEALATRLEEALSELAARPQPQPETEDIG